MARHCGRALLPILVALGITAPGFRDAHAGDFRPDPYSVQRYGPAYRYPQAGWIVLHIEGEPYERGYQHGRLMASEIAACVRCAAALVSAKAPAEGWKACRALVNALFVRRYEKEYLEEMKGIADGASAAGARFDNRPIDLVDIVGVNAWPEIDTLPSALEATPTGLEGIRFAHLQPRAMPEPKPMHCSAFAATGPATADGKIVFGHITMFGLYPSYFYNVWLDVKPARGHRVLMQTYPGGIQSGLDYYLNDAGLLVCETTITQTRFDIQGMSVASRIRQALQYADGIDQAVGILRTANNGLYTNEWLLADIKTNEIAMFELGTAKSKLYRSSQQEWFGGTEGFYWGCNNTKDLQVRLETIPGVNARPANLVWRPSPRDKTWIELFNQHRGKIDVAFGKLAFTTPPVAAFHSLDAKFTTTALAKELKTWALFGPPLGRTWKPTHDERQNYPEIQPLVSNPWAILHADPPAQEKPKLAAVDLHTRVDSEDEAQRKNREPRPVASAPAWHGTLLPKTDADVWLAAAFADYEKMVAPQKAAREEGSDGTTVRDEQEHFATELLASRAQFELASRAAGDVPLVQTHAELGRDEWYRIAAGKGILLMHELRQVLGDEMFEELLDSFGRGHAGKEVTTAEFQAHIEQGARQPLGGFFDYWLNHKGLPQLHLAEVTVSEKDKGYQVAGVLRRDGTPVPVPVAITVKTARGDVTATVRAQAGVTPFSIDTSTLPQRIVVDPDGATTKANSGPFTTLSFFAELEKTIIVYGTTNESASNREAAQALQRCLIERGPNITVPIKSDRDVAEEDLKKHHLLLIGRPDCCRCTARFHDVLPVSFGSRSFTVNNETYAHPRSAVVAAAVNPLNPRYSLVVLAGLSAEATWHIPAAFLHRTRGAGEVVVLARDARSRALVVPPRELVQELRAPVAQKANRSAGAP
jgi:hypothetical protein